MVSLFRVLYVFLHLVYSSHGRSDFYRPLVNWRTCWVTHRHFAGQTRSRVLTCQTLDRVAFTILQEIQCRATRVGTHFSTNRIETVLNAGWTSKVEQVMRLNNMVFNEHKFTPTFPRSSENLLKFWKRGIASRDNKLSI